VQASKLLFAALGASMTSHENKTKQGNETPSDPSALASSPIPIAKGDSDYSYSTSKESVDDSNHSTGSHKDGSLSSSVGSLHLSNSNAGHNDDVSIVSSLDENDDSQFNDHIQTAITADLFLPALIYNIIVSIYF
jgi:hypothetical protein